MVAMRTYTRANDAVVFDKVSLAFGDNVVFDRVSFRVPHGQMMICLGTSGSGKSTLLRLLLGLLKPDAGGIYIDGRRVDRMKERDLMGVRANIGMVCQEGGLFDSLTVRENCGYRLFEETHAAIGGIDRRVHEVLTFVGLAEFADRMPSELSEGQRRRAAIAAAIAPSPHLVLYDDPTTGLDPITALAIDAEIIKLRDLQHATSIVVTQQLRAPAEQAAETMVIMLKDAQVGFEGTGAELRASTDPYLRTFLS
jgi:phospholipid/cholesterol/gamma-HCH transport system ATP-binding protein